MSDKKSTNTQPELASVVDGNLNDADGVAGIQEPSATPVAPKTATSSTETKPTRPAPVQGTVPGQLTPTAPTSVQTIVESILTDYVKQMSPGVPQTDVSGAKHQLTLWRAIERVLNGPAEHFHANLNTLLAFMAKHRKGAFSERYVYRFFSRIELPTDKLKTFERLLNLFINTCEASGRAQALKQIDLPKTLESLDNEHVRQRLYAFYTGR